jgi:putative nucleotidyltransferase with HDIG domain
VLLVVPTILLYLFNRKEVDSETLQLLESMADAVDLRDPYTVGHSRRVAQVAAGILHTLGRTGQEAALVLTAARVHDIGKTVIPDHLLLKHGPLTGEERPTMERHATHGAELLEHYPDFARIVDMVRSHHERWDGGGYPDGLRATEIPYGARVIAVADAYVAMVSARSYRPALLPSQAAEILRNGRGRQWDPQIVDALLQTVADEPNLLDMPAGRPDESAPPDVAASAAVI